MNLYVNQDEFTLDKCIKTDPAGFCSVHRGRMRKRDVGVKVMRLFERQDMAMFLLSAWSYGVESTLRNTDVMTQNLAFNELYFLYKFSRNPFFGTLMGFHIDYTLADIYIFTEWVENKTLAALITRSESLSMSEFRSVYFQILFLIHMMQAMGITHCDLHAENILVTTCDIETSFERYILQDGREYFVPNCGKRVIIWDMTFARAESTPCPSAVELVEKHRKQYQLAFKTPLFEDLHYVIEVLCVAQPKYRFYHEILVVFCKLCFHDNAWGICDLICFIFHMWAEPRILLDDTPLFDFRVID